MTPTEQALKDGDSTSSIDASDRWTKLCTAVKRSGPQVSRTALVFLVLLVLLLPMQIVQTILKNWAAAHTQNPRPDLNPLDRPLPDILLNNWEERSAKFADISLGFQLVTTLILIIILKKSWRILRRLLFQIALMCFLRGLVLCLTLMPRTHDACESTPTTSFLDFAVDVLYVPRNVHACNTFIFSGHTALATLFASVWVLYAKPSALGLFGVASGLVTAFFVSFDRNHYTVDIALAIIISIAIVLVYHLTVAVGKLEEGLAQESERELQGAVTSIGQQHPTKGATGKGHGVLVSRSPQTIVVLVGIVQWVDARNLESTEQE